MWDYSGTPLDFTAWGSGEPHNDAWYNHTLPPSIYQGDYPRYKDCGILAKSDHGHVLDHWEWHEAPCSYNWGYVCEK